MAHKPIIKLPADTMAALKTDIKIVRRDGVLRSQGNLVRGHFENRLVLLKTTKGQ